MLKLADSNFKQGQKKRERIKVLTEQIKMCVDPVSETVTVEIRVNGLLWKSGKDLNSRIDKKDNFYTINGNEFVLLIENATQGII